MKFSEFSKRYSNMIQQKYIYFFKFLNTDLINQIFLINYKVSIPDLIAFRKTISNKLDYGFKIK